MSDNNAKNNHHNHGINNPGTDIAQDPASIDVQQRLQQLEDGIAAMVEHHNQDEISLEIEQRMAEQLAAISARIQQMLRENQHVLERSAQTLRDAQRTLGRNAQALCESDLLLPANRNHRDPDIALRPGQEQAGHGLRRRRVNHENLQRNDECL